MLLFNWPAVHITPRYSPYMTWSTYWPVDRVPQSGKWMAMIIIHRFRRNAVHLYKVNKSSSFSSCIQSATAPEESPVRIIKTCALPFRVRRNILLLFPWARIALLILPSERSEAVFSFSSLIDFLNATQQAMKRWSGNTHSLFFSCEGKSSARTHLVDFNSSLL